MAVSSTTKNDVMSGAWRRRLPHPLVLAWFAVLAGLLLLILVIAIFGKASDGGPVARIDIAPAVQAPKAKQAMAPAVEPASSAPGSNDLIGAGPRAGTTEEREASPATAAPEIRPSKAETPEPKLPSPVVPRTVEKPIYAGRALVADPALIEVHARRPSAADRR